MNPLWTPLVQRLSPYVPGEQPTKNDYIKLNTNENPYGPSPRVAAAVSEALGDDLRLYPDSKCLALRAAIAEFNQVDIDNVFVGNGSDEVLALAFLAFFSGGQGLQYPDISYSFYPVYCNLYGIEPVKIPLHKDMTLSLDDFSAELPVIFPNPNAPTSLALPVREIERLLERVCDQVVLVDEAYVDFGAESAVPLCKRYANVLVTQTFSKSRSLAGMRAGFAIANAGLIEALYRVKDSFNSYPLDTLAQKAATAAMQDRHYFEQTCQRIVATRDKTASDLRTLGFDVLDSKANFLFLCHPVHAAEELQARLREAGFLTRHWSQPRIANWLRITIGTEEEMQLLVSTLQRLVA